MLVWPQKAKKKKQSCNRTIYCAILKQLPTVSQGLLDRTKLLKSNKINPNKSRTAPFGLVSRSLHVWFFTVLLAGQERKTLRGVVMPQALESYRCRGCEWNRLCCLIFPILAFPVLPVPLPRGLLCIVSFVVSSCLLPPLQRGLVPFACASFPDFFASMFLLVYIQSCYADYIAMY